MKRLMLAVALFAMQGFAQTQTIYLRYGGSESYRDVTACTSATPVVCTTSAAHGFAVNDVVWFSSVDGMTSIGNRPLKVKAVPTSTTFSLKDMAGSDVAPNGTFVATYAPRVGKVRATTMPGRPRYPLDGADGTYTLRVADQDGSGPLIAGVTGSDIPTSIAFTANRDYWAAHTADPAAEYSNYGVVYMHGTRANAMLWYADNTNTASRDAAKYWLNHLDEIDMGGGQSPAFTACDESVTLCGTGIGPHMGYLLAHLAGAYSVLMTDSSNFTSGEQTRIKAMLFNGVGDDSATCTNMRHESPEAGTVSGTSGSRWITGDTGSGFDFSGLTVGDKVQLKPTATSAGYWVTITTVESGRFEVDTAPAAFSVGRYHLIDPWDSTKCGLMWFAGHHTSHPRSTADYQTTKLASAMGSSDTTITLTATPFSLHPFPWYVRVGSEEIKVTSLSSGSTYNCTRGALYTTAAAHASGGSVTVTDRPGGSAIQPGSGWRQNIYSTHFFGEIIGAAEFAMEDDRAAWVLMKAFNLYYDHVYPDNKDMWAGMNQSGWNPGYELHFQSLYNLTEAVQASTWSPSPSMLDPYHCLGVHGILHSIHGRGMSTNTMEYLSQFYDSGSDIGPLYRASDGAPFAMLSAYCEASEPTAVPQLRDWYRNRSSLYSSTDLTSSTPSPDLIWAYMPTTASDGDFTTVPTSYFGVDDAGDKQYSYGFSFADQNRSGDDATKLFTTAIDEPNDHLPSSLKPGHFQLWKAGSPLLLPAVTGGATAGSYNTTDGVYHQNWTWIGAALPMTSTTGVKATTGSNTAHTGQNITLDRYAGSTTLHYVRNDLTGAYLVSTGTTRALQHILYLKDRDILFTYNDFASGAAKAYVSNAEYFKLNTDSSAGTFSRTGADATLTKSNVRLTSRVLLPTDTAKIASGSNSYGAWVTLSESSATAAEFATIYKPSSTLSDTMPTTTTLTPPGWVGVQVGGSSPAVMLVPRAGAAPSTLGVVTSHTGTAAYALCGEPVGTYDVTMGGSAVSGSPFIVTASTDCIEFSSTSGTLSIGGALALDPPQVVTTSLPAGAVSAAYSTGLAATSGTAPYSWSLSSGTLCAGLSLSSGGGISGTPSAEQTCSFTVQVTDSAAQTATQALSITVSAAVIDTRRSVGGAAIKGRVK